MKKTFVLGMLMFGFAINSHGGSIQWNVAQWGYFFECDHLLAITAPDGTGTGLGVEITSNLTQATLKNRVDVFVASYAILLLPTSHGTLIDQDLFSKTTDPFFNMYDSSGLPMSQTNLKIPRTNPDLSNTFLLAFAIEGSQNNWYGWIEFSYKNGEVYIENSAVETTGQGIYAGVPEPSTALLWLSGCALLILRRRKPNHHPNTGVTP